MYSTELKNSYKSGILKLFFILISIFIIKYTGNQVLKSVYSIFLVIYAFFDKNTLFWTVFTFIYSASPAGLFDNYTFGVDIGSVVIDFAQLLILVLFFKTKKLKINVPHEIKFIFYLFILMLSINLVNGFYVGVSSVNIFFRILKLILPFLYINVALKTIISKEDLELFFRLIFPFVFISFLGQLSIYVTSIPPSSYFFGNEYGDTVDIYKITKLDIQLSRSVFSVFLNTIALMGALYYISLDKIFSKGYLILIVFISLFSFILSATRSWSISLSLIVAIWSVFNIAKLGNILRVALFSVLFFFSLSLLVPSISLQLTMSIDRLLTVEKLAQGDITAGGTAKRFDVRAPKVLDAYFNSNLFIGAGFSDYFFSKQDGHVGQHNLLLQSGIIGSIIMNGIIIFLIFKSFSFLSTKRIEPRIGGILLGATLIALQMINTTVQIFNYQVAPSNATLYGFILAFYVFISKQKKFSEYNLNQTLIENV